MTQDEAFLRAIIEAPDDDTPRLVYADWLDDQGQPERAEFIRLQCELARLPKDDPRRSGLEAREQALLQVHQARWAAPLLRPLPAMVTGYAFRRGFVERLSVEARGLLDHADLIFRLAPLTTLEVYSARRSIEHIASLPYLARLRVLALDSNRLRDEGIRTLASSPYLTRLQSLHLFWNQFGNEGAQALATCPALSRLAHLNLSSNHIGVAGAVALAAQLPDLQTLTMYWNPLGDEGRRVLEERFGARVKLEDAGAQMRPQAPSH